MPKRFGLLLATLAMVCACKTQPSESPTEPATASQASSTEPAPVADTSAAPQPLGEGPLALFEAADDRAATASWELDGETIGFRVEPIEFEQDPPTYEVGLIASVAGSEDQRLHACTELRAAVGGHLDLVLRGDDLHVLCINPAHGDDPGSTEAARFRFDPDKRELIAAGTYSGDASLDIDSVDLDEAE